MASLSSMVSRQGAAYLKNASFVRDAAQQRLATDESSLCSASPPKPDTLARTFTRCGRVLSDIKLTLADQDPWARIAPRSREGRLARLEARDLALLSAL